MDAWRYVSFAVFGALAAVGVSHAWVDQHSVTYRVVAHDPVCVAIYADTMEAVTRLTMVREHYSKSELAAGVPMLIRVPEDRAPDVAQSLLGRSLVYSVQKVGTFWNWPHTVEGPLHINPNVDSRGGIGSHCYDIDSSLAREIRQAVILRDGGAFASGEPDGKTMHVRIYTNNLTSMVAYLEDNGATVQHAFEVVEYKGRLLGPQIIALIPSHIIPTLAERGDFMAMATIHPSILLEP